MLRNGIPEVRNFKSNMVKKKLFGNGGFPPKTQ